MMCLFLQIKENFGSAPQILIQSIWYGKHGARGSKRGGERDPHVVWESFLCCGGDEGTLIWGTSEAYPERTEGGRLT